MKLTLDEVLRIVEKEITNRTGSIVTAEMGCEYDEVEYDFYEIINDADIFVNVYTPGGAMEIGNRLNI